MDYHQRKRKYTTALKILSLHSKTYLERAVSLISHKLSVSYFIPYSQFLGYLNVLN